MRKKSSDMQQNHRPAKNHFSCRCTIGTLQSSTYDKSLITTIKLAAVNIAKY